MSELSRIEVGAKTGNALVILLHGLGADGHDFVPIVPELGLPPSVKFIFPHAPVRPITLNGGESMRAWYDLWQESGKWCEDETGIRESARQLEALIEEHLQLGIPSNRIIVAGFSQGGAIALHTGLRFREPLGGVLALSTYLPLASALEREIVKKNQTVPIWMAHGTFDDLIPLTVARNASSQLEAQSCNVNFKTYPMGHEVCATEIQEIARWLNDRLA